MADTPTEVATSTSTGTVTSTATSVEAPPPQETKPATELPKRWADIEDEVAEEKGVPELDVGSLAIDENKKINKFLDEPEDSNIKAVSSSDTPYTSAYTFEELNLSPELLKGLYVEMKFEKPSKIQAISLPMINQEVLNKMGKHTGITSACAVPMDSSNYIPINKRPPITAQVVIGTPGTIKKWMSSKKLGVSYVKILVFDEADQMLAEFIGIFYDLCVVEVTWVDFEAQKNKLQDLQNPKNKNRVQDGFRDDSLRIMRDIERISSHCQVLLFSATFNEAVKNFVAKIVKGNHNQLFVKKEELSLESVKQYKVKVPEELSKITVIKERIFEFGERLGQTIIFVRTKNSASMLHKSLVELGYDCTTIHGNLGVEDRDKIVKEFKDGLTQVLISTDLLSRGFDQQQVNLVINYDLPVKYTNREPDYEVYLHRIGRAGRFGRKGAVFNFLCGEADEMIMSKIENHFGTKVEEVADWRSEEQFKAALKSAGLL
ncbi:hypothetical protein COLO4_22258 [Corchorus olitorius]|uniref:RNA helicase n=1 Tax=Corchorus olitorius TaxID=93759 RepID=A0A1R3IN98_9ROSI|nr:hypothetical protein COLO4_22258 [Corchorus olitorius]